MKSIASSMADSGHVDIHTVKRSPFTGPSSIVPLIFRVIATYLIHQVVNLCLGTVVPFWEELNHNSGGVQRKVEARMNESFGGIRELSRTIMRALGSRRGEKQGLVIYTNGHLCKVFVTPKHHTQKLL